MSTNSSSSFPAPSNVHGAAYPRINPDLSVTFRIEAPTATTLQVQPGHQPEGAVSGLGAGPYDMLHDDAGVWTVTTPPAVPGFHYYWLLVDGVPANDPASQTYFGYGKQTSAVDVPEPGVDFYEIKDVPHGNVRLHWYHSATTGAWRRFFVYAPPGYDTATETRYPVLYLQHGGGEDETGWANQGKANFILDNLLAAGQIVPMLVVMESGFAVRPGEQPMRPTAGTGGRPSAFEEVMIRELIPMVDATYRTIADREHRAMAGLSMGSLQTLQITLSHLDTFSSIGAFSVPPENGFDPQNTAFDVRTAYGGVFADAATFNQQVRLFFLTAGTAEERFVKGIHHFACMLDQIGVTCETYDSPGTAHDWQTWRRSLQEFAPRLFRA